MKRIYLSGPITGLRGWQESKGAQLEVLIARHLYMTVMNAQDLVTREAIDSGPRSGLNVTYQH